MADEMVVKSNRCGEQVIVGFRDAVLEVLGRGEDGTILGRKCSGFTTACIKMSPDRFAMETGVLEFPVSFDDRELADEFAALAVSLNGSKAIFDADLEGCKVGVEIKIFQGHLVVFVIQGGQRAFLDIDFSASSGQLSVSDWRFHNCQDEAKYRGILRRNVTFDFILAGLRGEAEEVAGSF